MGAKKIRSVVAQAGEPLGGDPYTIMAEDAEITLPNGQKVQLHPGEQVVEMDLDANGHSVMGSGVWIVEKAR